MTDQSSFLDSLIAPTPLPVEGTHCAPPALIKVIERYTFDTLDEDVIRHCNGEAQTVCPGPYKIYVANGKLCIAWHFENVKEHTWWMLKWS